MGVKLLLSLVLLVAVGQGYASPQNPHVANCASSLPFYKPQGPCSWFEGWYTRIIDPSTGHSFAAIVATINGTGESHISIISYHRCQPPKRTCGALNSDPFISLPHGKGEAMDAGGADELCGATQHECGVTQLTDVILKEAAEILVPGGEPGAAAGSAGPPHFDWVTKEHGYLRVRPSYTEINLKVGSVLLEANLTDQKLWDPKDPEMGPEGWLGMASKYIPVLPCRWHVYSMGSAAMYTFLNSSRQGAARISGTGFAHEEKNWGKAFPDGHFWAQALSPNNSAQIVLAGAYFQVGAVLRSPSVHVVGYRSARVALDFRTTDPGTLFSGIQVDACKGTLALAAHTLTHSLYVEVAAPPASFSPPLLGPTYGATWRPLCAESFGAVARVRLLQRGGGTGVVQSLQELGKGAYGEEVESVVMPQAALEFGEGMQCVEAMA